MKNKKRARYGTGCVYQRGRVWWVKFHDANRHAVYYKSSGSEDREVAERLLRRELQAQGGRRPLAVDPKKVSYETVRENFLEHCVAKGLRSLKWTEDKKPTLATLPRLDRSFGGWRASDITVADLKRFRLDGRRDGLSDVRLNRYMATVRAMLKQAVKDELLTSAEVPGYFPVVKEQNEARGAIFIEPGWYGPLRKALREPLRSAFTLAYATGIRVHEMFRLRWRDVNLPKHLIVLPGEITKTGKNRTIHLPSDFDLKPGKPDELLFPVGSYRWEWYDACCKVGAGHFECLACGAGCDGRTCPTHGRRNPRRLKYRGVQLRHTRHTAVRNMSDAGLPETRIMAISGHVTRSMFDRYNVGRERDVDLARDAIERFHRKQQKVNRNQL